jgi:hypothetical protein
MTDQPNVFDRLIGLPDSAPYDLLELADGGSVVVGTDAVGHLVFLNVEARDDDPSRSFGAPDMATVELSAEEAVKVGAALIALGCGRDVTIRKGAPIDAGAPAMELTRVGKRIGPNPDHSELVPASDPRSAKWLYECAFPGCTEPRDVTGPVLPWNRARWPKCCAEHREHEGKVR